ncbi:MAG: hypothetical protein ACRDLO_15340 [Solirubrobacterales bacterium]
MSLDSFIQALQAMHVRFPDEQLAAHRRRARGRVDRASAERRAARQAFEAWPHDLSHERVRRAEVEWEDAVAVGEELCS